ncbi:cytosolic thiouridylase subunit Ctu1 [Binucleata daphniae]
MSCYNCKTNKAILIRPKNMSKLCKNCFILEFENDVHETITENKLFEPNENVAVAISGGKDSTVLAYVLNLLNIRHNYNINLFLLSVDEGIKNYRDFSLETVQQNKDDLDLPLKIVSYKSYFDLSMDEIVQKIGRKSNCTYCGVFRRQALENGAKELGVTQIVTGHNADDMAETVLMNILRGDISRLRRCTAIKTRSDTVKDDTVGDDSVKNDTIIDDTLKNDTIIENNISDDKASGMQMNDTTSQNKKLLDVIPRSKPFKYIYEKDIVMYAFYNNLNYFSVECCYSPGAYRGHARLFIKELERKDPGLIIKIIKSGEDFECYSKTVNVRTCKKCKHSTSSQDLVCKSCTLLEDLQNMNIQSK